MFVAVAFAEGEFGASGFVDVFFCEDADAVERSLQFCVILLLVTVRRNGNGAADAHESAAERLRDHGAIPGLQHPCTVECDVEADHGRARGSRQHHRAGLGNVAWTAWTI